MLTLFEAPGGVIRALTLSSLMPDASCLNKYSTRQFSSHTSRKVIFQNTPDFKWLLNLRSIQLLGGPYGFGRTSD